MHTFEVSEDDLSVQRVSVLIPSVLDHRVDDSFHVVRGEVTPATRTRLLVHRRQCSIERRTRTARAREHELPGRFRIEEGELCDPGPSGTD